jgi:hypothetical protein
MTENWGRYITNIQGVPGSVMLDLGVAENAPLAERPWRSGLSVKMIQPLDNGLLNREEYNTLMAMGDALTKALDPSAFTYVGRLAAHGAVHLYAYAATAGAFRAVADRIMGAYQNYRSRQDEAEDRNWRFYFDNLYPSPEDEQRMNNMQVCLQLIQAGDRLDQPRKIDHFAIFDTTAAQDAFAQFARSKNYEIVAATSVTDDADPGAPEKFTLEFSRIDKPAEIDAITIELAQAAKDTGGSYDGWGAPIVASS